MVRGLLILLMLNLTSCLSSVKVAEDGILIDVMKVCRENPELVEKIMVFSKKNFNITKQVDPLLGEEQVWELGKYSGDSVGLEWMQLKFYGDKLQSVWFGPRQSLEEDMKKVGINMYFLRSKDGKKVEFYDKDSYTVKDVAGKKMTVEHEGAAVKGVQITCFNPKK